MSRVILFLANGFEDYAASAVIDKKHYNLILTRKNYHKVKYLIGF